jgi:Fe-S-cluster containining protein
MMGLPTVTPYQLSRIQPHIFAPFIKRLKKIFASMDQKYQEAADYYDFNCKGCEDNCCLTRFYHYTLIEYLYIKEGFHGLEDKKQVEVKQRSLTVCRKTDEADRKGQPVKQMCPVNFGSLCVLYSHRPMICRLHGIPHELHRPGQGILNSSGCGTFALKCHKKTYFKFDRTPFYMQMAALEKEMKQAVGMTQKIKMTVAQMIVTFDDG